MNELGKTNIDLTYRCPKAGPETDLVNAFIEERGDCPIFGGDNFETYFEPSVGHAYPDIVITCWDQDRFDNCWNKERNSLDKTDIKILHHMYLQDKFFSTETLKKELGYSNREIERTITKLMNADLLVEEQQGFRCKRPEDVFFVTTIISIEAKIKNWKKAFEQAWLNGSFASESYVLLPRKRVNRQVEKYADEFGVGLIGYETQKTECMKKPVRNQIPSSYSSWLFNENIGRQLYYSV